MEKNKSAPEVSETTIHPSAFVESNVEFGSGCKIWHMAQIRSGAKLGRGVSIGKDSYVDANVRIGEGTRVQNQVNIYVGVEIGRFCFVGPAVVFTNDQFPRVGNRSWKVIPTVVEDGASIGAGAVIRCGVKVGAFAMIGAGALVTKDVPPFTLVVGHPAGDLKRICACGQSVHSLSEPVAALIRDCCRENMSDATLSIAAEKLAQLAPSR